MVPFWLCGILLPAHALQMTSVLQSQKIVAQPGLCSVNTKLKLFAHHKTGTVMSRHAVTAIKPELATQCHRHISVEALDEGHLPPSPQDNIRFLHFERNPFEVVVSAYLYHQGGREPWMSIPISSEKTMRGWHRWHRERWMDQARDGFSSLIRAAEKGQLPKIESDETFTGYLKRVDDQSGLYAEALVASHMIFPNMELLHEAASSQQFGANVCLPQFYEDCHGTWTRSFETLGAGPEKLDALVNAASTSCPGADPKAIEHSSTKAASSAGVQHPPLSQLMKKIKWIDNSMLDQKLAMLELKIGCPFNPDYTLFALGGLE